MAPFRQVSAYAPQGVTALGLGVVSAIFTPRPGLTDFEVVICTGRPGLVRTDLGLPVTVTGDLDMLAAADLVLLLPHEEFRARPPAASWKHCARRTARARRSRGTAPARS